MRLNYRVFGVRFPTLCKSHHLVTMIIVISKYIRIAPSHEPKTKVSTCTSASTITYLLLLKFDNTFLFLVVMINDHGYRTTVCQF